MNTDREKFIAIVDIGRGNLLSIVQAFNYVGLQCVITSDHNVIQQADAVVLPGVGAFGDAMQVLKKHDLVPLLRDWAESGKYLIGICLGMQLLFTESDEFGTNKGLDLIAGNVVKLPNTQRNNDEVYKVPQVGWNTIYSCPNSPVEWDKTPLKGINEQEYMYFMHSYYVQPSDDRIVMTKTKYAGVEYCSSIYSDNVMAFQFHPERSGKAGLAVYSNIAEKIRNKNKATLLG